jgi:serine/threonine-protein kinase
MTNITARLSTALADRYKIERHLGEGGMATVYLAEDLKHDRKVAIKVLKPELSAILGGERFLQEIKVTARLTHPHILPLFDSGDADGFLYYVMPLMEGESLRDRMANSEQMGIDEAVQVAREVADALDYAHRHDTVHRDIKPENIMLHEGHAVVVDFGIAKAVAAAAETQEAITQTGVTVGTPAYMSPEQAAGEENIDGRSDLFSLGCVLFEMLTGEQPFTGRSAAAVIAKRFAHTPPPVTETRSAVSANLSQAVSRLLERAPEDRIESGAALVELLVSGAAPVARRPEATPKSVAVLPFANLSPDPENEYFADGMTEELINTLSQIEDLHVASRTSCFYFKGKNPPLRDVGRELKVGTVLTGGVRKAGSRVRITVQLVDIATDEHLWSERYDRQLDDIFDLQDELARAIATQLKVALSADSSDPLVKPGTTNLDAYQLYLKGRYFWNQRGPGLKMGLECFERALELDPKYALAHAGVGDSLSLIGLYGGAPARDVCSRALEALETALRLDDSLDEAHNALALLQFWYEWDFWGARERLSKVLETNPRSVQAWYWRGACSGFAGTAPADEAIADCERAVNIDPLAFHPRIVLSWTLICERRYEKALPHLEQVVELQTTFLGQWLLGLVCRMLGQPDRGAKLLEAAVEMSNRHVWALAELGIARQAMGHVDEAAAIYEELTMRAKSEYVQKSQRAMLAANLGYVDETFELLEAAVDERDGFLVFLLKWPSFDPVRDDPRFTAVLDGIGFPR